MKTCPRCKTEKPATLEHFYRSKQTPSGLLSWCKPCHNGDVKVRERRQSERYKQQRAQYRKDNAELISAQKRRQKMVSKYGITPEERQEILDRQGGTCALCPSTERLAIDHKPGTKTVRGILCFNCNTSIGKLGDDARGLAKALVYVSASEHVSVA